MEHIFIINPVAGKGKIYLSLEKDIHVVMSRRKENYQVYLTMNPGDAMDYVQQCCQKYKSIRFYACGGDGTLHEVVNGVMRYREGQVSITVFPCGTGNDFIKNFDSKTGFLDIESLVQAESRWIDLLKINERFTINICNVGFDAKVAYNMKRFKQLPWINGSAAYTLAIFYCLFNKLHDNFQVEIEGQVYNKDYLLVIIANGCCYGGGYCGAPLAKVDDGCFDVIEINKLSIFKIVGLLKLYKKGLHLDAPQLKKTVSFKRGQYLELKSNKLMTVCTDGEVWQTKGIKAELVPQVIEFAVPK